MSYQIGDRVRVVDYKGGEMNGFEGVITNIDNPEDTNYPYRVELWSPYKGDDFRVFDGVIHIKSTGIMRDGEFEKVEG